MPHRQRTPTKQTTSGSRRLRLRWSFSGGRHAADSACLLSTPQRQSDLRDQTHREVVNRPFQFNKRSQLFIRTHSRQRISRMNSMRIGDRYRATGWCTPGASMGIFFRLQICNLAFALRFRRFRPFDVLVHMGLGCGACQQLVQLC
jgi:hypothetical protein